ncbi:MAG: LicD family protein [Muribaculaceae bacterium]|nr:LicD family protein [Muribaculaceae bacterium]
MKELSLDRKKEIMVEIMNDIDRFCRENNIKYSLYCGTLLGAVRHGGFIPWDDDLDICMLREDFEKFIKTYKNRKYYICYEPGSGNGKVFTVSGFAKVCDPNTRIDNGWSANDHGIYVDVFPIDNVPEDKKEREKYMRSLMRFNNRMYHRGKKDLLSRIKCKGHDMEWWWNKYENTIRENRYKDSKNVAHIMGCHNFHEVFSRDRFENLQDIKFEGETYLSMADPHGSLAIMFGDDYMTPPPPEKRINHGERAYGD